MIQLVCFNRFVCAKTLKSRSLQFGWLTDVLHLLKVVIIFSEAGEVNVSLVVSVKSQNRCDDINGESEARKYLRQLRDINSPH